MRPDVGERHQRHRAGAGRQPVAQGPEVHRAVRQARHHLDGGAGHLGHLEQAQVVAVVGQPVDQEGVAAPDPAAQEEPPDGLGPGLGVRAGDDHLVGRGPQQATCGGPHRGQPVADRHRRLVAAPLGLDPEVVDLGVEGGPRWAGRRPALLR